MNLSHIQHEIGNGNYQSAIKSIKSAMSILLNEANSNNMFDSRSAIDPSVRSESINDEAIDVKAVNQKPVQSEDLSKLYLLRSICYQQIGTFNNSTVCLGQALADVELALQLTPTNCRCLVQAAFVCRDLKHYQQAEIYFQKLTSTNLLFVSQNNCIRDEAAKNLFMALRERNCTDYESLQLVLEGDPLRTTIEEAFDKIREGQVVGKTNLSMLLTDDDLIVSGLPNNCYEYDSNYNGLIDKLAVDMSSNNLINSLPKRNIEPSSITPSSMLTPSSSRTGSIDDTHAKTSSPEETNTNLSPSHKIMSVWDNIAHEFQQNGLSRPISFSYPSKLDFAQIIPKSDLAPPNNIFNLLGLWIGNVAINCSVQRLEEEFSRFGTVKRVIHPDGVNHAFVHFTDSLAPVRAITELRGQNIWGVTAPDRAQDGLIFRFASTHRSER